MSNPVHTSENEDVRGFCPKSYYCLKGSTWRKVMREKANQVQPSRLIKIVVLLSEGILSFVEYAPRLLIVLPSRQFWTYEYIDNNII